MDNDDLSYNRYNASHLEEKRSSPRAPNRNTSVDTYETSGINLVYNMTMCHIGKVGSRGERTNGYKDRAM